MSTREASPRTHFVLLLVMLAVAAWSFIEPRDRFTWYLEAIPSFAAAIASRSPIRAGASLVTCVALAISAAYELVEWAAAMVTPPMA